VVLPLKAGGYALAWKLKVFARGDLRLYFVSASDGRVLYDRSDKQAQTAQAGLGTGVLRDSKKMSASRTGATFYALDVLRPPDIFTCDLKGNVARTIAFLNGDLPLTAADVAQDADNTWADGAVVDAHSYSGWTYDYFFKRFGRRGLDDQDLELLNVVHPVNRDLIFQLTDDEFDQLEVFFDNAFYAGGGVMVYGEGFPANVRLGGHAFDYMAGMLDVVAHELTHGVTEYTSNLDYEGEPGALNESFSDMMGTGAEFFHQPAGDGPLHADYLLAEDAITPGGVRSMSNPASFGDPDHYSGRYTGTGDNGGVHINSAIPNQVFYLAIEGGANRTSGLTVTGVGGANREQVEKVMYRAFTRMMGPSTDFRGARAATLQAATDLYGVGSPVRAALAQAWTAVGVN
jgi:thermolysin